MPVEISERGDRIIAKFAFHPGAVEKIKALPGAKFSGSDRSWSISKRYAKRLHQTAYEIDALLAADEAARKQDEARRSSEIKTWVRPERMKVRFEDGEFSLRFAYDLDDIAALKEMVPARRWVVSSFKISAAHEARLREFLADRAMKSARETVAGMMFTGSLSFQREQLISRLSCNIQNVDRLIYGPQIRIENRNHDEAN